MYGLTCGIEVEEGRLHVKHFHCQMETSGQNECKLLISAALSWPVFKNMCTHTHTHTHTHTEHTHTHTVHSHTQHTHTHTHSTLTHSTLTLTHTHTVHSHTQHTHTHTHTQHTHTHTHSHIVYIRRHLERLVLEAQGTWNFWVLQERKMMNRATCSLSLSIVYSPL